MTSLYVLHLDYKIHYFSVVAHIILLTTALYTSGQDPTSSPSVVWLCS